MEKYVSALRHALKAAHAFRKEASPANQLELCNALHKLQTTLQEKDRDERRSFLNDKHFKTDIFLIYSICKGPKSRHIALAHPERRALQTCFDQFFAVFNLSVGARAFFDSVATDIFQAFVEGITYFEHEQTSERPIYHRASVCGSGNKTWSVKMTFDPNDSLTEIERKKRIIRLCYIERAIFNFIFKRVFEREQDSGHLRELRTMENLHQYAWNDHLCIDVRFRTEPEFDIFPNMLVLVYHHYPTQYHEEYTKYPNMVYAIRRVIQAPGYTVVEQFEKQQTYKKESSWLPRPTRGGGSLSLMRTPKRNSTCMPKHARSF